MNKRILYIFAPSILCMASLVGCKQNGAEAFYAVYKIASDNFQKSTDEYTIDKITVKDKGVTQTVTNIEYGKSSTEERYCHISYGTGTQNLVIAGSDIYTYYDDSEKGIKWFLSLYDGVTYSTNLATNECSFKISNSTTKFNKNGYITQLGSPSHLIEISYIDE